MSVPASPVKEDGMDLGLTDKVALVTASSRGMGRAVARVLAQEGAHVVICARGQEDLDAAAAEIDAAGRGRVVPVAVDLTEPDAAETLVSAAQRKLGPPDLCLVNNGGPRPGNWSDVRDSHFDAAYRVLVESAVRICREVLPEMMQRGFGRIVQLTSVSVRQPVEGLVLSNVMRPAVHALTRALAVEAAGSGVTVNSVAPGYHQTERMNDLIADRVERGGRTPQEVLADLTGDIPAGRLGDPDELAALVTFLMSRQAGYITGQCIVADGGWVRTTF
jgi:3-oxoacyl-[acyl-carrier protein] reductase